MRPSTIAIILALLSVASRARADEPEPTPDESTSSSRRFAGRLGALAAYRGVDDLSLLGEGVSLSLGSETDRLAFMVNLHFIDARTLGGLTVLEAGGSLTLEGRLGPRWRVGGGVGVTYLDVQRVTSNQSLQSMGPTLLARVAYDFGERPNLYVLADVEVQWQASGTIPWGPTLQVGLRF